MREIMDAIFYAAFWLRLRMLPDSFLPRQTVYGWFLRLRDDNVYERLNHRLVMVDRERVGWRPAPRLG